MAGVLSRLSEELVCSICHEYFNTPKVMDCLHRFCKSCIHDYIMKTDVTGGVPCSQCRQLTASNSESEHIWDKTTWADYIPTDFLVASMCDILQTERHMCLTHPENEILSYCKDCQGTICHVCAAANHRKCKGVVSLKSEAEEERTLLKLYQDSLRSKHSKVTRNLDLIKKERQMLRDNRNKTADKIKVECNRFEEKLRQEMGTLYTQLDGVMYGQEQALSRAEHVDERVLRLIQATENDVSATINNLSDMAVVSRGKKRRQELGVPPSIVPGTFACHTDLPVKRMREEGLKSYLADTMPDLTGGTGCVSSIELQFKWRR